MRRLATSGVYSVKDFDLLPIVYVKSPCTTTTTTTTTTIKRTLPAPLVFTATPTLLLMIHTIVESKCFCSCERTPLPQGFFPFCSKSSHVSIFSGAVVFLFVCVVKSVMTCFRHRRHPHRCRPPTRPPTALYALVVNFLKEVCAVCVQGLQISFLRVSCPTVNACPTVGDCFALIRTSAHVEPVPSHTTTTTTDTRRAARAARAARVARVGAPHARARVPERHQQRLRQA
jgi:hypothetical protein